MNKPTKHTQTDWVSRLGCMRRNTVITNSKFGRVEHIELWVPNRSQPGTENKAENKAESPVQIRSQTKQDKGPIR